MAEAAAAVVGPARVRWCAADVGSQKIIRQHSMVCRQVRGESRSVCAGQVLAAAAACRAETFYEGEDYNWKYELLHPTVKAVVGRYNRHHHLNIDL